jgi:hypothetical protein
MSHLHPNRVHPIITKHLGHFNADAAWYLEHHGQPSAERLADIIADRDSKAVKYMTGRDTVYVIDHDEWRPQFVAACQNLMNEVLYPSQETWVE